MYIYSDNYGAMHLVFIPVFLYVVINYKTIREIEAALPYIPEIVKERPLLKYLLLSYVVIVFIVAMSFLLSGNDLGDYIKTPLRLSAIILGPALIPVFIASKILYQELKDEQL